MPGRDGTGPGGLGYNYGYGKGKCFGFRTGGYRRVIRKNGWLAGITFPLFAAVVRDIVNPEGFLGKIVRTALQKKSKNDSIATRRDAEYTIIEDTKAENYREGEVPDGWIYNQPDRLYQK